ncbi:hypothetical protein AALO_G00234640 [Alosa alosa]|uniref:AB hydrolase-1 domain-containing protein n=2 Tax=Alosa alosa TaxID=278164 RepID=A0AAV6FUZ0_9TELE|nr:(Lyso)-N-acylphosphatidylethanolamine lipase-like isoform X1 [Alosa alosa]KAG5266653.1 hypothetical protein AALO_G00234640 [Alosa alosa]
MQDETEFEDANENWAWRPTSMALLETAESRILARLHNASSSRFVTLPDNNQIRTLTITAHQGEQASKIPLVMVHGFGGGMGLWIRNLDPLSCSRTVHAFDLLGFGRSSRPDFPMDAKQAEDQWVTSIEQWRQAMGVELMILLGHSLGGYLVTSYAIRYPDRVAHLILVDPWGFPKPWFRPITSLFSHFNLLGIIRGAGPLGPALVSFRRGLKRAFKDLFDDDTVTNYVYHCNAQQPSGEVGFRAMNQTVAWAQRPMIQRVHLLRPSMPLNMLLGGRSWLPNSYRDTVDQIRGQSHTQLMVIPNGSHHFYADQYDLFNREVQRICDTVD